MPAQLALELVRAVPHTFQVALLELQVAPALAPSVAPGQSKVGELQVAVGAPERLDHRPKRRLDLATGGHQPARPWVPLVMGFLSLPHPKPSCGRTPCAAAAH